MRERLLLWVDEAATAPAAAAAARLPSEGLPEVILISG